MSAWTKLLVLGVLRKTDKHSEADEHIFTHAQSHVVESHGHIMVVAVAGHRTYDDNLFVW